MTTTTTTSEPAEMAASRSVAAVGDGDEPAMREWAAELVERARSASCMSGSAKEPARRGPDPSGSPGRPDFVTAAPTLPGVPRIGLPSASPGRYDGLSKKGLPPPSG